MNVAVSLSNTPMAHPPRSNPFLRSSSDAPPFPCIPPSTVTCVMVVSFIVAPPLLAVFSSSFDSAGPRRRSHRSQQSPPGEFRARASKPPVPPPAPARDDQSNPQNASHTALVRFLTVVHKVR